MKRFIMPALVILIAISVSACSSTAKAQLIAPDAYVAQFTEPQTDHILIDVRTPAEFDSGYIEGAINIPVDDLARRLSEIPEGIPVVVYCRSGSRSARAANILTQNNFSEVYDLGGVIQWTNAGYSLQ